MLLDVNKDVHDKLIWDVVETLTEISDTSLRMLLEDFELRVLLIQLM